jgi:phage FluMu protein Com
MVMVRCPSCSKNLNVPDKYAGKKAKCPACKTGTLTIPAIVEEVDVVEEEEAVEAIPVKRRKPAPPVAYDDDEEEDRIAQKPARRARRPVDDDDEDDRPRRKKRRKITGGEWAPCPNCGCSDATRVRYTFWGGIIAPLFINIVRCHECGTSYNGIHGDYNTTRIIIYVVINVVLGLALAAFFIAIKVMTG